MISINNHPASNHPAPDPPSLVSPQRPQEADARTSIRLAVDAALGRKAVDLKVLNLGVVSDFTDYFLICSGTNERQVQAIADAVIEQLRSVGIRPLHVEGQNFGRWILLDYGGWIVVHIFLEEVRRHYNLEGLWADAHDETVQYTS